LAGALAPLAGSAPTNVGGLFVSGDYNRETGLAGDGSTKYLDSNRNNNADPQNSQHLAVYISTAHTFTTTRGYIGGGGGGNDASHIATNTAQSFILRSRSVTQNLVGGTATGFVGISRASAAGFSYRASSVTATNSLTSTVPANANIAVFNRALSGSGSSDGRIAFYSIGESLDLALLDARVTDLINAFAAAIP
jgi:hypothetical protein